MIYFVIPVGVTKKEFSEYYFNKDYSVDECIVELRELKKIYSKYPVQQGGIQWAVNAAGQIAREGGRLVSQEVVKQGAQAVAKNTVEAVAKTTTEVAIRTTSEVISTSLAGGIANPLALADTAGKVLGQIPGVNMAVGAYSGYQRTGDATGAVVGAFVGGSIAFAGKTYVTTAIAVSVDTIVTGTFLATPLAPFAPLIGKSFSAGVYLISGIATTAVSNWAATKMYANPALTGGGSNKLSIDDNYFKDIKNLTVDNEKLNQEVKHLLGEEYYSQFMNLTADVFNERENFLPRMFTLLEFNKVLGYFCFYLYLSTLSKSTKTTNKTRKIKNSYTNSKRNIIRQQPLLVV